VRSVATNVRRITWVVCPVRLPRMLLTMELTVFSKAGTRFSTVVNKELN
jgi:hypothetical protein